jgi:hypothetical protein
MNSAPNPAVKALHSYFWWLSLSMIAYAIAIIVSRSFLHTHPGDGPGNIAVALLPIIPVIFVFVAVVRLVLATDEMQRRIIVNSLALAGGVTALLAVTYGLLEGEVLPRPSAWITYITFMTSWIIAGIFVRRHYR